LRPRGYYARLRARQRRRADYHNFISILKPRLNHYFRSPSCAVFILSPTAGSLVIHLLSLLLSLRWCSAIRKPQAVTQYTYMITVELVFAVVILLLKYLRFSFNTVCKPLPYCNIGADSHFSGGSMETFNRRINFIIIMKYLQHRQRHTVVVIVGFLYTLRG